VLEKFDLEAFSRAEKDACRRHNPAMLDRLSNFFKSALEHMKLPSGKRLQAIVTECYGSLEWLDSPGSVGRGTSSIMQMRCALLQR
jgi:hypothetical protein